MEDEEIDDEAKGQAEAEAEGEYAAEEAAATEAEPPLTGPAIPPELEAEAQEMPPMSMLRRREPIEAAVLTRKDTDLDSVTYGTPGNGQIKVYFDATNDFEEEVKRRVDLALVGIVHAEKARSKK